MNARDLVKYFIHGVVFSALFTILIIAWTFFTLLLVSIGGLIGLAIGLVIMVVVIGFVNGVVTALLWFPVKSGFWELIGHGLMLLIILVLVNVVVIWVPSLIFPSNLVTTIVTFLVGAIVDGYVGKAIAGWFREERRHGVSDATKAEWLDRNL